jgi:hypothetical protein
VKPPVWILTFNRPEALNRLITEFGRQGFRVNVFSNHPTVKYTEESTSYVDRTIINTLNSEESNSWCARSWNTMFMKAFPFTNEAIFIQDDTFISPEFAGWIEFCQSQFDFVWGPAGDQFFYMRLNILQNTGWWDERFIGCYCGDCDFVKRVWFTNDQSRLSIEDTHHWGWYHNYTGMNDGTRFIITTRQSKDAVGFQTTFLNQHHEFEKINPCNPTVKGADNHFLTKWGVPIDSGKPAIHSYDRKLAEIDWYPWATRKFGIKAYD